MKYCTKCGNELMDEAVICPKCGCMVEGANITGVPNQQNENDGNSFTDGNAPTHQNTTKTSNYVTVIKVFLILGCIAMAAVTYGIALAWCIPMTIYYFRQVEKKQPIGTAFKVCTLLFVNLIAGIFMLCEKE